MRFTQKNIRVPVFAVFSLVLLSGCIARPDIGDGGESAALIDAFRAQSNTAREERETQKYERIESLLISEAVTGSDLTLSATLKEAELARVLALIFSDPRVRYHAETVQIPGRVTARFVAVPIVDALNILLTNTGYIAALENGIIRIEDAGIVSKLDTSGEALETLISREIPLKHLLAADAVSLLSGLYRQNDTLEASEFSVESIPELNAVFVSGPATTIEAAVQVIARADRPVAHVIIEALVVDIDTSTVESLGLSFADGASGNFSGLNIVPGQTGGNIVAAFTDLAANTAQVTATINFLAAQNAAEVVARPYLATRSTMPATIDIVNDQFARVDTSGDDSAIISTDSVTAGVSMQITPVVTSGGKVRMDVAIEESRFGATAGDVIIVKERNAATTSMMVHSGQTMVIGGLNSRYRITENDGLPWLRHVPLLNLFAGEQVALETRKQLVVYLTPYIWQPGLDTPLPLKGRPKPHFPALLSIENGGQLVD